MFINYNCRYSVFRNKYTQVQRVWDVFNYLKCLEKKCCKLTEEQCIETEVIGTCTPPLRPLLQIQRHTLMTEQMKIARSRHVFIVIGFSCKSSTAHPHHLTIYSSRSVYSYTWEYNTFQYAAYLTYFAEQGWQTSLQRWTWNVSV